MGAEATQQEWQRSYDGVLRREVPVSLRVLDAEERSVEVIASTEALDSHGDIVKQFWDLSRYNKNGPVLWNHNIHESSNYSFGGAVRPEDTMPVGKGTDVRVESKQLIAKLTLVKGSAIEEPFIDKLWRRIQQGVIKAVSVGFRPGQVNRVLNAAGGTDHFELGSAERPNELREISFVPMGSNPEAVAKSIAWERKHLEAEFIAASAADEGTNTMTMTDQEKQALEDTKRSLVTITKERDDALTAKGAAELAKKQADDALAAELAKSKKLADDVEAEKKLSTKLQSDLDAANKRASEAEALNTGIVIDGYVGKKLTPAEKDEYVDLAKTLGLDRVKAIIEKRPDLGLTTPVKVEGKDIGKSEPAPEPVTGGDPSADIAKTATDNIAKRAS
jgi:hypothetical protein